MAVSTGPNQIHLSVNTMSPIARPRCFTWHALMDTIAEYPVRSPSHSPIADVISVERNNLGSSKVPVDTNHQMVIAIEEMLKAGEEPTSSVHSEVAKAFTTRNPWGNESYCDLITRAILVAEHKRATLAQSESKFGDQRLLQSTNGSPTTCPTSATNRPIQPWPPPAGRTVCGIICRCIRGSCACRTMRRAGAAGGC